MQLIFMSDYILSVMCMLNLHASVLADINVISIVLLGSNPCIDCHVHLKCLHCLLLAVRVACVLTFSKLADRAWIFNTVEEAVLVDEFRKGKLS
jgi:hypothetical protein